MDDADAAPITDPASVLIGLGAVCGLIAAGITALALGLASAGYLLGRFTGRF